jgi:two-component system sensor kinase FixL
MSGPNELEQQTLVLDELRRFVRLRWFGGSAVVLGSIASALAQGWSPAHGRILAVGAAVLAYNVLFAAAVRRAASRALTSLALGQLLADLAALSLLAAWTGGAFSPVLLAFLLHMVVASLLLPRAVAYASAAAAMLMVVAALAAAGHLPPDRDALVALLAWAAALLLTVYLAGHLAGELRRREEQLRLQNRKTQGILETAAEGIITIDERATVQSVNPAAERIFGYSAAEVVGRNVRMLMPEPDQSAHDGYINNYLRTGQARIIGIGREVEGRRKDGTRFPLELAISEVVLGNGRLFTGILRDISERKRAEAGLKRLNDELRRHQDALVQHEKMAAMGQMAAGVAHEIANPLAGMDSLIQLVDRHPQRFGPDTAATLRQQIARIDRLVRQMKDFAHPAETIWETSPLNQVVEGALDLVRLDPRSRGVEVIRELSPQVGPLRVMPHALQQVIVNLVLNALDAVEGAERPRIEVATRRRVDESCVIEVTDNGRGIAPEHLGRIFEPFFTTKPVGAGTGLGLSISYSIVERHRGRLEVRSTPGLGSTFSVILPASCDREPWAGPIPRSESAPA